MQDGSEQQDPMRKVIVDTGERICSAWACIVELVCRRGTAAKWHIDKARQIPGNDDKYGLLIGTEKESEKAKYIEQLPSLIDRTEAQGARVALAWTKARVTGKLEDFLSQRRILRELLREFAFREVVYERLVSIPEKPMIKQAQTFIESKREHTAEARAIEDVCQQTLAEIVADERAIDCHWQDLATARDELAVAHAFLVDELLTQYPDRADARAFAEAGLRRATKYYDYRRGYSFATYAEWWIKNAIEKRR